MSVAAILARKGGEIIAVPEDASLEDAAKLLDSRRIGAVLILSDHGTPAGVLSERDIARAVARQGAAALSSQVRDGMTREVVTCAPGDSLDSVMGLMTDRRIRHLPVLDGDRLVGIVSIGDVVKQKIAIAEAEAEAMKTYITQG